MNTVDDTLSSCAATGQGTCSLRDAITFANRNPGLDEIAFSIGVGPQIIRPTSPLPPITDATYVLGWTQPATGTEPVRIELDGALAGAEAGGLQVLAGGSSVLSLSIYGFSRNAIRLSGGGASVVSTCFLGVNHNAVLTEGNRGAGVLITSSPNHWIGFPEQLSNVIAGNQDGIRIEGQGSDGNILYGNYVGTDYLLSAIGNRGRGIAVLTGRNTILANGAVFASDSNGVLLGPGSSSSVIQGVTIGGPLGRGNTGDGVLVNGSSDNLIGGDNYAFTAVKVLESRGYGIRLVNGANRNQIIGNQIGTLNQNGTAEPEGNEFGGIRIEDSSNNLIGGEPIPPFRFANVIAFNHGPGIGITGDSAVSNQISANIIRLNAGLGIDLGADGVTPNRQGTVISGPNHWQNYPVLTRAVAKRGGTGVIEGLLKATPSATFRVELFANTECHAAPPADFGEGQTYLGSISVTTDPLGEAAFSAVIASLLAGQVVTATATDADGSTSEFSQCKTSLTGSLNEFRRRGTRIVAPRSGN